MSRLFLGCKQILAPDLGLLKPVSGVLCPSPALVSQELDGVPPLLLAVNLGGGPGLESRGPSCSVGLLTILSTVGTSAWAGLALGSTHTLTSCAHGSSLCACPRSQLCSCFCLFPRRLDGAKSVLVMAVLGCVGHVCVGQPSRVAQCSQNGMHSFFARFVSQALC